MQQRSAARFAGSLNCPAPSQGSASLHPGLYAVACFAGCLKRTRSSPSSNHTPEWVKELKRVSNLWLNGKGQSIQWQGGYAAFSVSQSNLAQVRRYIEDQPAHHRKLSFHVLRTLLRKHDVGFDERYVWD